ncbi:MAG TPA: hypothetical protein VE981_15285 [Planctomycetota bacterium]|nr:hypothetical protein [Planctomycetota bacterium]
MSSGNTVLRLVALLLAGVLLPCCGGSLGEGDSVAEITVRASLPPSGLEPNKLSLNPSVSDDGRFVVFESDATNLTANDNNGVRDIFVRDRATGKIENITNVPVTPPPFPNKILADCFNPVISGDGHLIAFVTKANLVPSGTPPFSYSVNVILGYDRSTGTFVKYFNEFSSPDRDLTDPSISRDGRFISFTTAANVPGFPNAAHLSQVYVLATGTGVVTLVSRASASATTICNVGAGGARISPDGGYVVFDSGASNFVGTVGGSSQVYMGTPTGAPVQLISVNSSGNGSDIAAFGACVSEGGVYVAFNNYSSNFFPAGNNFTITRHHVAGMTNEIVTNGPASLPLMLGSGFPVSLSADGRYVAFLKYDAASQRQVYVRDLLGDESLMSRHFDGTDSNLSCSPPSMSGDGRTVAWHTVGSTLVEGDTNGVEDVYYRTATR